MGGKGSGGSRVGAGRHRKDDVLQWLGGNAGKRSTKRGKKPAVEPGESFEAPLDLPELHREAWERLAPHAFEARTLTPGTVQAFRDLCECIVVRDGLLTQIHRDGYGGKAGKHPLLTDYRGMQQRVEAGLMRFRLAPLGKPMAETPAKPDDPFDEFDDGTGGTAH